MKKFSLGVFGGGYKPFTLGHFSMLALAASENDRAVLLYGISGRDTEQSDYEYSKDIAKKIFEINKVAIKRELQNVDIIEANPPLSSAFGIIESIKGIKSPKVDPLSYLKIDPKQISCVTNYDGPDDIWRFKRYESMQDKNDKNKKYFGNLIEEGLLKFDSGPGELRGYEGMLSVTRKWIKNDSYSIDLKKIRGTTVRKMVSDGCNIEEFKRVMPPIYTEVEIFNIFEIMKTGIKKKNDFYKHSSPIMVG